VFPLSLEHNVKCSFLVAFNFPFGDSLTSFRFVSLSFLSFFSSLLIFLLLYSPSYIFMQKNCRPLFSPLFSFLSASFSLYNKRNATTNQSCMRDFGWLIISMKYDEFLKVSSLQMDYLITILNILAMLLYREQYQVGIVSNESAKYNCIP